MRREMFENLSRDIEKIIGEPVTIHAELINNKDGNKKLESPLFASTYDALPVNYQIYTAANVRRVASFSMGLFNGCCGICISYHSSVSIPFRKKGLGTLLNKFRRELARLDGYTILLCTDVVTNKPQRKLLENAGWKDLLTFKNNRSGNTVALSMYDLNS